MDSDKTSLSSPTPVRPCTMRIRALVQARMRSDRLPGKVLMKIGDLTIVEHIASRMATLSGAGVELVFAIADETPAPRGATVENRMPQPSEEPKILAEFLENHGFSYAAGDEMNVLKRFVDASADLAPSDYIIRQTADNPFVDKDQLGLLIARLKDQNQRRHRIDYAYTADLPLGMGAELIRVEALRSVMLRDIPLRANSPGELKPHHREHVTTYIRENPHLYEIYPLHLDDTLSSEAARLRVAGIRLTVDEAADLIVARRVFEHFKRLGKPHFGAVDVIQLAKNNPEMLSGNETVRQKSAESVDARLSIS